MRLESIACSGIPVSSFGLDCAYSTVHSLQNVMFEMWSLIMHDRRINMFTLWNVTLMSPKQGKLTCCFLDYCCVWTFYLSLLWISEEFNWMSVSVAQATGTVVFDCGVDLTTWESKRWLTLAICLTERTLCSLEEFAISCVCVCVCACVRACMRACVRAEL